METAMIITSPSFKNMGKIPDEYTCQGEDINPPLLFEAVPEETEGLVLVVDDPDAPIGTWDHWLVVNIEPTVNGIAPGSVPAGGHELINSFGKTAYGGPCPPNGQEHRYFFKLYALDSQLDVSAIYDKPSLYAHMQGHILASAELVGLYKKP
jgi:Raf kinase inhibitor-like YbhB/YbcL family protein